jgi:CHAD domain-containing protein
MAYRLKGDESVAQGLRRVAKKELEGAVEQLGQSRPPSDDAIHEARKSVKKARAVLRLIEADRGGGLGGSRKRLRTVNRALSRLRDADVMKEVLATLNRKNPRLFSEHTFARLQAQLTAHKEDATRTAIANGSLKVAARELRKLRRAAKRWRPAHRRFAALGNGIEVTHRRGRRAMARAMKRQTGAEFHEWRKQIKALSYELRLIDCCSAALRKDTRALHHAETYLGDDHNVGVLCAYLSLTHSLVYNPMELVRLRRAADRYQRSLRKKAVASVRAIYAVKPGVYRDRAKRWWKAWLEAPESRRNANRRAAA